MVGLVTGSGVGGKTAFRVGVTGNQEVHTNRSIGVGARLDVLRTRVGHNCGERARGEQRHIASHGPRLSHPGMKMGSNQFEHGLISARIPSANIGPETRRQRVAIVLQAPTPEFPKTIQKFYVRRPPSHVRIEREATRRKKGSPYSLAHLGQHFLYSVSTEEEFGYHQQGPSSLAFRE